MLGNTESKQPRLKPPKRVAVQMQPLMCDLERPGAQNTGVLHSVQVNLEPTPVSVRVCVFVGVFAILLSLLLGKTLKL